MVRDKGKGSKFGPMGLDMLENGKVIKPMDMEFYIILMGTSMKVSG
jgi:hypothetical protein